MSLRTASAVIMPLRHVADVLWLISGRKGGRFNLNTVNSLHSYIKRTYEHYHGVSTKYINRYNALFSVAFRCVDRQGDTLFSALCTAGASFCCHSVNDGRTHHLVMI